MNRTPRRQVLECASPLALSNLVQGRKSGRGLPQSKTASAPAAAWSRFMVPMRDHQTKEAFHEPTHPQPLPGGEQAFVRVPSVPLLGGVRGGFMVSMHAPKTTEAVRVASNAGCHLIFPNI